MATCCHSNMYMFQNSSMCIVIEALPSKLRRVPLPHVSVTSEFSHFSPPCSVDAYFLRLILLRLSHQKQSATPAQLH